VIKGSQETTPIIQGIVEKVQGILQTESLQVDPSIPNTISLIMQA